MRNPGSYGRDFLLKKQRRLLSMIYSLPAAAQMELKKRRKSVTFSIIASEPA